MSVSFSWRGRALIAASRRKVAPLSGWASW